MNPIIVTVDSSQSRYEWGDGLEPTQNNPISSNYGSFHPRRSISTVTGPNRRDIAEFYQNFRNIPDQYLPESEVPLRPSIVTGISNQSNSLQPEDEISFDPIRFSPPNVTPPPMLPKNDFPHPRVRFNDVPSYSQPGRLRESVPPRKCSLAPNFFSSQNSHHMYPDQYTPRTWQNNEFISGSNGRMENRNCYPRNWNEKTSLNMHGNDMNKKIRNSEGLEIQIDDVGYRQTNSQEMMDVSCGEPIKTDILSPVKMSLEANSLSSSPSFLQYPGAQKNSDSALPHKKSHPNVPSRKASVMALQSNLRDSRGKASHPTGGIPYTPPPILAPMRNGSGLFCSISKSSTSTSSVAQKRTIGEIRAADAPNCSSAVDATMLLNEKKKSEDTDGPSRKNGFFYIAQQMNKSNFADELEALRKESWQSTSSTEDKVHGGAQPIAESEAMRKASMMSDSYYDYDGPQLNDSNPHVNIGKEYQAKVRKWNDREVHHSELEAIEDRDEIVFSSQVLEDIDPEQITAFELLACSQACPRAGRNKELALHLLMENKGNIEAAVEDLLRSDTLDWEQYSTIFGYLYNDSVMWTPDEVYQFQDAIYKSEKDFDKVAQELPGKSARECIQFYYTWKKACPDDYRKLRNLRRKRTLLEINLQQMEDVPIPMKKCSLQESVESDAESNTTDGSFSGRASEFRDRAFTSPVISSPRESPLIGVSPLGKDIFGAQKTYQPTAPRPSTNPTKKGAQPSADGFFHCRLCDKCFEKVKSLNAHMKSHAMKARAEQEAKAHDAQLAAALSTAVASSNSAQTPPALHPFANTHLGIAIPSTAPQLTPQQINSHLNQTLQSQLNTLSSQLNSQLQAAATSPLTPHQQLHFTQQQLVARAMQQNLFQPQSPSLSGLTPTQHSILQAGLHTIN